MDYNKLPRNKSSTLSAQTERLARYSGASPEKFVSLSHSSVQQAERFSASRNKYGEELSGNTAR